MKKQFESIKIEVVQVSSEDIIKTSQIFNGENLPGFGNDDSFFA